MTTLLMRGPASIRCMVMMLPALPADVLSGIVARIERSEMRERRSRISLRSIRATELSDRERQAVGPAECDAGCHGLHRLENGASLAPVVAGIDERHRTFDQFHDGDVAGRADLQGAELGPGVDDLCRVDGRHGDDLLERESETH